MMQELKLFKINVENKFAREKFRNKDVILLEKNEKKYTIYMRKNSM